MPVFEAASCNAAKETGNKSVFPFSIFNRIQIFEDDQNFCPYYYGHNELTDHDKLIFITSDSTMKS